MAIVANPIIGRASGSVGNATFSQWKGRNVLKQKPTIVTNPRTALQVANRTKFSLLMQLGKLMEIVCKIGFLQDKSISWLNNFVRHNTGSQLLQWNATNNEWEVHPINISVSDGSIYPTVFDVVALPLVGDEPSLAISWSQSPVSGQDADDKFVYSIFNVSDGNNLLISNTQLTINRVGYDPITDNGLMHQAFLYGLDVSSAVDLIICGFFVNASGNAVSPNYNVAYTFPAQP